MASRMPGGCSALFLFALIPQIEVPTDDSRPSPSEPELRAWLESMVLHHRYTDAEIAQATGLTRDEVRQARGRFKLQLGEPPNRADDAPLLILPYPGGRHPRLGFLDGAIDPQRETKVSVFPPWPDGGYAVADVPEAIFSNLGLTYLAHTHVPTIWTAADVSLPPLEWERGDAGSLFLERRLPNGVSFNTRVQAFTDRVEFEQSLTNGTEATLTNLRVQNCIMLGRLDGFQAQTNDNKILRPPYAAARSADGHRWIVSGFVPNHRSWANAPVPCLHADPKFPDCPPGQSVTVRGWLSFFEGVDLDAELMRIDETGWMDRPPGTLGFEGQIAAFEAADRADVPSTDSVLFLGSSTIRLWDLEQSFAGLPLLNRGFGGSRMDQAAHFAPRILAKHHPRLIVIYEGDNDIQSGRSPRQVADDLRLLLKQVRAHRPDARVIVLGIKPSPARWDKYPLMREANTLMAEVARDDGATDVVDLGPLLLGTDGRPVVSYYQTDGLHLSPAGYRAWSAKLAPLLSP